MDVGRGFVKDENGSISVIVIAFFLLIVTTAIIVTDISAIAVAKRSLTQATESAAQRGVRNLDKKAYYSGEFDISTMVGNILGIGPSDPGIPIDCRSALGDAQSALADWTNGKRSLRRSEIDSVVISDLSCDGFGIQITTRAVLKLPIVIPLFRIERIEIESKVSTLNMREKGFAPFGLRIS